MKMAWKKLLSDPPSSWARLPLLTRGVGDELLRAVDSSGELDCGEERPADVVCRLTGAHPRERRRVVEAVTELLQQGFLVVVQRDGRTVARLALPDLSAPGADPKRTRSRPEAHPKPT